MQQISYFDFCTKEGLDLYISKARSNADLFNKIFHFSPEGFRKKNPKFKVSGEDNVKIIREISQITRLPLELVEGINLGDEILHSQGLPEGFGCTSVSLDGVIAQTLDLFTVDLSLVKEQDALYVTMPPYLTLMGMNKHISFCTNVVAGPVQGGIPVSHMRRDLLRCKSLNETLDYLKSIERATSVNFLISDGRNVVDAEVTTSNVNVYGSVENKNGIKYCAHTNHLVHPDFLSDNSCSRLKRAVSLLKKSKNLDFILQDSHINVPIFYQQEIGFGSILQIIMDVGNGKLCYKDPFMKNYGELQL